MNVLGLIPARGGSKGVPQKNIRSFCGKPLVAQAVEVAFLSRHITKTIVSTDAEEIASIARGLGAEVPFLRPGHLAQDTSPDYPLMEHAVCWLAEHQNWKADLVVFLRPTNVFRTAEDIDKACEKLLGASDWDAVRGVSQVRYSPYWMKSINKEGLLGPFVSSPWEEARRQDLPAVYQANGAIEVVKAEAMLRTRKRFGEKIGAFPMSRVAAIDIDSELDFQIAEFLYQKWKANELSE